MSGTGTVGFSSGQLGSVRAEISASTDSVEAWRIKMSINCSEVTCDSPRACRFYNDSPPAHLRAHLAHLAHLRSHPDLPIFLFLIPRSALNIAECDRIAYNVLLSDVSRRKRGVFVAANSRRHIGVTVGRGV